MGKSIILNSIGALILAGLLIFSCSKLDNSTDLDKYQTVGKPVKAIFAKLQERDVSSDSLESSDLMKYYLLRRPWFELDDSEIDKIGVIEDLSLSTEQEIFTSAIIAFRNEDYKKTDSLLVPSTIKQGSSNWVYSQYLLALTKAKIGELSEADSLLFEVLIYNKKKSNSDLSLMSSVLCDYAEIQMMQKKYFEAEKHLLESAKILNKIPDEKYLKLKNNYFLVTLYWRIGDYNKAHEFISEFEQNVLNAEGDILSKERLASIYHWKGLIESGRLNRKQAKENYLNALNIYRLNDSKISFINQNRLMQSIALIHMDFKEFEQAKQYSRMAIELTQKNNLDSRSHSRAFLNSGIIFLRGGEYDSAEYYLTKSRQVIAQPNSTSHILPLFYLGETSENQKLKKRALEYFDKSLIISKKSYSQGNYRVALTYRRIANILSEFGEHKPAIDSIQQSLISIAPYFEQKNYESNPDLILKGIEKRFLLRILSSRGKILTHKAIAQNNLPDLHLSLETYQLAQQVVDSMRTDIRSQTDKFIFLDEVFPLYDGALETAWELQQRGKPSIKEAFHLLEKGKANVLHESLQEEEARLQVGLPKEVIEKEQYVKQEISSFEKRLDRAKQDSTISDSLINKWRDKLIGLRKSQDSLLTTIKRDYPNYYQMRYDLSVVDLSLIQDSLLDEDQAMVEYFVGTEAIYAVTLTKDTVRLHRIEKDFELESWVKNMLEGIYGYHSRPTNLRNDSLKQQLAQNYAIYGHKLYEKLIAPLEADESLPEKLIIVPDGILGYLPFDALLSDSVEEQGSYRKYPYLMHEHQISYCYSATLWHQMRSAGSEIEKNKVLAMGLSFRDGGDGSLRSSVTRGAGFSKLRYAKLELDSLTKALPTTRLTEEEATVFRFKQMAPQYAAIHLSTHGVLNDEETEYSYLALAGADPYSPSDSGKLYVKDLYNIPLNAELVVLSACETGLGELFKGEGIISLARGFAYAGAKSIITTLWSVDDMSTARITGNFYKHLREGHEKDEALRLARMDYFKSMDTHSAHHPFYWAAMTPVGDMSPLNIDETEGTTIFLVIGAIVILILLLIWFYLRSRNSWRQNT